MCRLIAGMSRQCAVPLSVRLRRDGGKKEKVYTIALATSAGEGDSEVLQLDNTRE